jgi:hypothetical protein
MKKLAEDDEDEEDAEDDDNNENTTTTDEVGTRRNNIGKNEINKVKVPVSNEYQDHGNAAYATRVDLAEGDSKETVAQTVKKAS